MKKTRLVKLTTFFFLFVICSVILTSCYSPINNMVFVEVDGGYEVTGVALEGRFYKEFSIKIPKCNSPRPLTLKRSVVSHSSTFNPTLTSNSFSKRSFKLRLVTYLPL